MDGKKTNELSKKATQHHVSDFERYGAVRIKDVFSEVLTSQLIRINETSKTLFRPQLLSIP